MESRLKRALRDPKLAKKWALRIFAKVIPNKLYLSTLLKITTGEKMDWKNPTTYNQKCNWMKLYHRHPLYTELADKILAKQYVESVLGPGYTFPLIATYDRVEDIDFDALPNQFVIKANHNSGGLCICKDKVNGVIVLGKSDDQRHLSYDEVRAVLKKSLSKNYYWGGREWPYKNIRRRILVETFMQQPDGSGLNDFKFFCFNGEPKYVWMGTNYTPMHFDVYSAEWKNQHVEWGYSNAGVDVAPPDGYEQMLEMARKLSKGIPHVRVDFYNIGGKIYVGEFTFYTWAGLCNFKPEEWNRKFGELIDLSKVEIIR